MLSSAFFTLAQILRFVAPLAVTLAFLATEGLFVGSLAWYYLVPMASVPCVFFFAVHRPGLMTLLSALLVGLAEGAIFASPLGLAVIPLVLTVALVNLAGRALRHGGFALQWIVVSGLILAKILLFVTADLLLRSAEHLAWLFYVNKLVLSILLYPITHFILSWINFALGDS